jgi:DNA-binding NarL/FixJ family response regulator
MEGIVIGSAPFSATTLDVEGWRHVETGGPRREIEDREPLSASSEVVRVLLAGAGIADSAGLAAALARHRDIVIAGSVCSGEEALSGIADAVPNVVLLERRQPGMSAAATCRALLHRFPDVAVAVLSPDVDDASIRECLNAGARGYALDRTDRDLAKVIRAVARGDRWLDPEVVDRIIAWALEDRPGRSGVPLLSQRERAVLALLAAGKSNQVIADRLEVSIGTVKATIASLLRKLRAKNRTEAVSTALRLKIL